MKVNGSGARKHLSNEGMVSDGEYLLRGILIPPPVFKSYHHLQKDQPSVLV